jgi:hypothetical protein
LQSNKRKTAPSWNGRHLGRELPEEMSKYWTAGLGLMNKFSKFGPNLMKFLAQIEKVFVGGRVGKGRGVNVFLKKNCYCEQNLKKLVKIESAVFFKSLRSSFNFSPSGGPGGSWAIF